MASALDNQAPGKRSSSAQRLPSAQPAHIRNRCRIIEQEYVQDPVEGRRFRLHYALMSLLLSGDGPPELVTVLDQSYALQSGIALTLAMSSDRALLPRASFSIWMVLVDTVPAHMEAWARMFREFGYPFDARIYEHHIDSRPRVEALRSVMDGATPERIAHAAAVKNGYFLENLQKGLLNQFETSAQFVRAWKAKGVRMATASSSVNVRLILRTIGLIDAFDVIIGGNDVQLGKPEPEVFKAGRELGVSVRDCVVFQDAITGVQAAKAGGFFCVGILRYGEAAKLAGADRIIMDLSDIPEDDTSFWNPVQTTLIAAKTGSHFSA